MAKGGGKNKVRKRHDREEAHREKLAAEWIVFGDLPRERHSFFLQDTQNVEVGGEFSAGRHGLY